MSGYDGYQEYAGDDYDDDQQDEQQQPSRRRGGGGGGGATPLGAGLAGLLVGALLAAIVLVAIGGNPFSDANDVVYRDVTVAEISDAGDQICWSTEPGRRDAPLECAILAMDPAAAAPEDGEAVTIGLVQLRPPDGRGVQQVVYVRGSAPESDEGEASPGTGDGEAGEGTGTSATDAAEG